MDATSPRHVVSRVTDTQLGAGFKVQGSGFRVQVQVHGSRFKSRHSQAHTRGLRKGETHGCSTDHQRRRLLRRDASRCRRRRSDASNENRHARDARLRRDGLENHWRPLEEELRGTATGSVADLKIVNRRVLSGTIDGEKVEMARVMLRPIPAAEMAQSDPGPTGPMKAVMDGTPDYQVAVGDETTFWYAFGPVLYRGRLDGTARVLGIASDPGPAECLPFARRALIGDSVQKTQGFLAKLGLTRSYALVNGFAVALRPSQKTKGKKVLRNTRRSGRPATHL